MKPRAIVWDLFGDHLRYIDGGRVPMRVLNQLLDMFGVGESTTRVVLSRMRREGWFTTSRDGRQTSYALTGRSVRMLDEGQARIFDRGPRRAAASGTGSAGRWPGTGSARWPRPPGSARTPGSRSSGTPSPGCRPPGSTCSKAGR
jgi:hypothetical protein